MSTQPTTEPSEAAPTPAEAWQKLERSKSSYKDIDAFSPFVLTAEDEAAALALAEKQVYGWEQHRDSKVQSKVRETRREVARFITDGLDRIWLLAALERGAEITFEETERTGKTWTSSYGNTHHETRKLGRADYAALLVLREREERDELEAELEGVEDKPLRWVSAGREHDGTEHAFRRQVVDDRFRLSQRILSDLTPYRLWSLVERLRDEALDELRADFHLLYAGEGEDMGRRAGDKVIRGFDTTIDTWVKAWDDEVYGAKE